MPSLNLKTKKLRYAAADLTAIDAAITLLETICEYDAAAKKDATDAKSSLGIIRSHVNRQRNGTTQPTTK